MCFGSPAEQGELWLPPLLSNSQHKQPVDVQERGYHLIRNLNICELVRPATIVRGFC